MRQLTDTERRVWQAWNELRGDIATPVRTIARRLDLSPADVAAIVYPPDRFGPWSDDQEPVE